MKDLTTVYSDCETAALQKPHPPSEQQLWDSFRNGCEDSYALIYQQYFHTLYSYGLKVCSEREIVRDCIQDLFIYIWKNREKLSSTTSIKFYLYRSLKTRLIDSFKFQQKHFQLTDYDLELESVCSEEINIIVAQTSEAQQKRVLLALEKLTERQKESLKLKFYEELSSEEIGKRMSISVEGVYNLVSKALSNFGKNLSKV
ncbi:RNA polymerase sigma factor [Pontibacter russatus]|uniref:RNA polymerase sigma factor n=1 Tax=Pontibacter russatus TaxID=2694929 RepID=UPI00137B60CB|nr:sigma-70 family RNA polymerase sigma factor [Pontibacter russatus]